MPQNKFPSISTPHDQPCGTSCHRFPRFRYSVVWSRMKPAEPGAIIITGASRGIGAVTAPLAAARGFAVAVNYVQDRASAEAVVKQIVQAGGRACAVQADVAIEDNVLRLFDEAQRELGPIRALV